MSIVDHLEELRWRILKSLGSIFLMSIITFNFANYLVDLLIEPANQISGEMNLQVLTIQGMFLAKMEFSNYWRNYIFNTCYYSSNLEIFISWTI
jgi:Sec-independent protein secretion pathway component TatC